jgi:hypothetical protein
MYLKLTPLSINNLPVPETPVVKKTGKKHCFIKPVEPLLLVDQHANDPMLQPEYYSPSLDRHVCQLFKAETDEVFAYMSEPKNYNENKRQHKRRKN